MYALQPQVTENVAFAQGYHPFFYQVVQTINNPYRSLLRTVMQEDIHVDKISFEIGNVSRQCCFLMGIKACHYSFCVVPQ